MGLIGTPQIKARWQDGKIVRIVNDQVAKEFFDVELETTDGFPYGGTAFGLVGIGVVGFVLLRWMRKSKES